MNTLIDDDMPEREDLMHRALRELQEHLLLQRLIFSRMDSDGSLSNVAEVLLQKRGCRR